MNDIIVPVFVKEFNQIPVHATTTQYPISTYFPKTMRIAFERAVNSTKGMRDDDYIICPVYKTKDIQIGVTGGVHKGEAHDVAAARELGEEIGIVPKTLKKLYTLYKGKYANRLTTVYECYMNDMMPVLDHQHGSVISKGDDDRSQKVGCFAYGSKNVVQNFLESNIYVYDSPDTIIGVAAIKVSDIISIVGI